jgi:hypothetical protein
LETIENGSPAPAVSPGREFSLMASVPYTPVGDDVNKYKYYCPICMNYFKDILRGQCCGNYTCLNCCKDYLAAHSLYMRSVNEIIGCKSLKDIPCPNCASPGFDPRMVALVDGVRDYSMKNDYVNILRIQSSPIRVGDSFDELKRKMIKYSIHTNMNNSSSGATEITNNDFIKQLELDFAIDANPSTITS